MARAAAVTGCSGDLTRRLAAFESGPPPRRMPYGADIDRFAPLAGDRAMAVREEIASRHGLPPGDRWLLAVGRLVYKKGFDVLVRALPRILEQHQAPAMYRLGAKNPCQIVHNRTSLSEVNVFVVDTLDTENGGEVANTLADVDWFSE